MIERHILLKDHDVEKSSESSQCAQRLPGAVIVKLRAVSGPVNTRIHLELMAFLFGSLVFGLSLAAVDPVATAGTASDSPAA